ncbi:hypothetical protein D3C71_1396800 [compost metagenome]
MADHDAETLEFALIEEGHEHEDVGQVHAALVGVVDDHRVTGREAVAVARLHRGHGFGNGAQVQRDGLGLRDHLAVAVADRGRVVHDVLDDFRARGAQHGVGDFVHDGVHRVLDHGEGDRVDGRGHAACSWRSMMMLPTASARALQCGGTTIVVS